MSQDPRDPGWFPPESDTGYSQGQQDQRWQHSDWQNTRDQFLPEHQPWFHQPVSPSAAQVWNYPPAPQQRSRQGAVALCMAVGALLVSSILSWIGGTAMARMLSLDDDNWYDNEDYQGFDPATDAQFVKAGWVMAAQILPTLLGIAALVLGIVACQKENSRTLGILAIIASVLAPVLSFCVFLMAMLPYLES